MNNLFSPDAIEHRFPSSSQAAKQVVDEILARLDACCWSEQDVFGIHLALEEALMNAIKHGNRGDPSKFVVVRCEIDPQRFCVEITDEGDGFNPDEVPDPTLDENLDRPSGRGLMLMRCYMSEVRYNACGNSVVMVKYRRPDSSGND